MSDADTLRDRAAATFGSRFFLLRAGGANMGVWNYRVVRRSFSSGDAILGIHTAYYHFSEDVTPHSISTEPRQPLAESVDGLAAELERFREALGKPVLEWSNFDREHAGSNK